jgi:hypothetical protein
VTWRVIRQIKRTAGKSVRLGAADIDAATVPVEEHLTVGERKQRVVASLADIATGMPFRSALPNQDVASDDVLATKLFDSQPLGVRIATVAAGALSLLMSHVRTILGGGQQAS